MRRALDKAVALRAALTWELDSVDAVALRGDSALKPLRAAIVHPILDLNLGAFGYLLLSCVEALHVPP